MTDITVTGADYSTESRTWVDADPGEWTRRSVTLDLAAFDRATHYPNGYIPSGIPLAPTTAAGATPVLYGPATDGKAEGFLWNSTTVKTGVARVGAPLFEFGLIRENKLPLALPAAAKTALAAWFKFRSF